MRFRFHLATFDWSKQMFYISLGVILWFAVPALGRADVIFNTFGPGDIFNNEGLGFELFNGTLNEEVLGFGPRFTPSGSFLLDQISLPLGTIGGSNLKLEVLDDASGQPGHVLETFQIGGIGTTVTIFTVNSVLHPLLAAHQPYWLIGFVPSGNLDVAWYGFPTSEFDVLAHGPYSDGHWDIDPNPLVAFRVMGTPVPEAAPWFMLASGLACLIASSIFRGTGSSALGQPRKFSIRPS
jgi:hypothetical protein